MRKAVAFILGLAIIAFPVGNAEAGTQNRFNDLSAFTSGEDFRLIFDFEKTPSTKVTFKKDLAQIEVSNAYSIPSKKTFELNRSGIKEILVYQFDKKTLRIRIFPLTGMEKLRKDLSFTTEGNKLVINLQKVVGVGQPIPASVDAKKNAKAATSAKKEKASKVTKKAERKAKVKTIAKSAAKTKNKVTPQADEKLNFNLIPSASAAETADSKGFLNYTEPKAPTVPSLGEALVKVISSLFIVLAIVIFLAFIAKKYRGTIEAKLGSKNEVKVISSHFIGVKKEVTIIEIGGEILVLGVTSQNINLLAKYDDPDMIDQIKLKNRTPGKPRGVVKKIPGVKWGVSAKTKTKISNKFENQVNDEEAKIKEAAIKESRIEETRVAIAAENKNMVVSKAAQEIADKLKAMRRERSAAFADATA